MKWQGRRQSSNVEDRRGSKSSTKGGLGIIGVIIVMAGAYYGYDLSGIVRLGDQVVSQTSQKTVSGPIEETAEEQQLNQFARVVLAETEDTWGRIFKQAGKQYRAPNLVLYRNTTATACGTGQAIMGPFYCPADNKIYLDLSFHDDMRRKLKADGDFAFAYVIAHEVGHHVQNLLGISEQTHQARRQARSKAEANRISVKVELQADCFAGVWAHDVNNKQLLDVNDIEEAFVAAQAVGDDRLQKQQTGRVIPDSFTHGSSEQRLTWFRKGLQTGDINHCNTFTAS